MSKDDNRNRWLKNFSLHIKNASLCEKKTFGCFFFKYFKDQILVLWIFFSYQQPFEFKSKCYRREVCSDLKFRVCSCNFVELNNGGF